MLMRTNIQLRDDVLHAIRRFAFLDDAPFFEEVQAGIEEMARERAERKAGNAAPLAAQRSRKRDPHG